ncbi:hypothetical protein [Bremerella alba]|uniref:Uncharacterized protein n=1 Tax=Bremerella alba TaxID=980252 RepID=A0A7V8V151_9BACT|nr:hypothetical protein [Bremerella alba]MBA2113020.1 hypothetical protein [Bremerella alba]
MLFDEAQKLPDEFVQKVSPVRVREYLKSAGWLSVKTPGDTNSILYQRPNSKREQILVPTTYQLDDYSMRMAEVIAYVASFEQRSPEELLSALLLPEADILRVQESSETAAAGDLPLDHALSLLNGVKKAILASACSVIRPARLHRRMSLGDAEQLINSCRLGQTERGSFVMMVACPLDAVPSDPDLFDTPPFTRRVTTLLMRSISHLVQAIESGDTESLLRENDDEYAPLLSTNLCEGLLEMQPEGDRSFIRISASFSQVRHVSDVPTSVRLSREIFPRIESLINKLRPVDEPRSQAFVGYVETLNGRPNAKGKMEGQVTLRLLTPDIDNLRARIELESDAYAIADYAHMHNRPVSLEGVLRQVGRTYKFDHIHFFHLP